MIDSLSDLIEFLRHFHRSWIDDTRLDPSSIPPALPDVLATVYRELGGLIQIQGNEDNDWRAPFATQNVPAQK